MVRLSHVSTIMSQIASYTMCLLKKFEKEGGFDCIQLLVLDTF